MAVAKRGIQMPKDIAEDPVQSSIWGEIAPDGDNGFAEQDAPNLRLLCFWHAVAKQAQEAIAKGDGHVAIFELSSDTGEPELRKHPALGVLKDATAQIRALSELLGVSPRLRPAKPEPQQSSANGRLLTMVLGDRDAKARKAAGA